jgi:chromosome partitioning protein
MAQVYSIAIQKGGTGKTSTSISLAAGLAKRGKNVLLVDADAQANASKVLVPEYNDLPKEETIYITILERKPLPVRPSKVPNLDIVPSHILVSDTDMSLASAIDHREARLKIQLDKIKDKYDFVIIDCPPALNWQTINALTASDYIIAVVEPGGFELDSTIQFGRTVTRVQEEFNPNLTLKGFLFAKSDPTNNSRVCLSLLRRAYPEHVLKTVIPRNVDMREANTGNKDIFEYNPRSRAAEAYQRLIDEVFV